MNSRLEVPKEGDYLLFTNKYFFMSEYAGPVEVPKGTLAKVIERKLNPLHGDELECKLVISLDLYGEDTILISFSYTVHQNSVNILPNNKATKLLYKK